ncbi:MAG: biopolymer transporter ExbD [Pirellulaceae bacterium]|jgi:biopolymer transport protein ExbD|nr:biopolymer transporter ExbD [Pirellulaceae bacterium]
MRLSKHPPRKILGVNLTPLIDIVFLLIIFFMTVSQITRVSQDQLQLAVVSNADQTEEQMSLIVVVNEAGSYEVQSEIKTLSEIQLIVQEQLARLNPGQVPRTVVKIDRRAKSDSYNALMRTLKQLGISDVRISVLPE